MEKREKDIDEMVALIEELMETGSMHVRVRAGEAQGTQVHTQNTNECLGGACMQPTEKLDEGEEPGKQK